MIEMSTKDYQRLSRDFSHDSDNGLKLLTILIKTKKSGNLTRFKPGVKIACLQTVHSADSPRQISVSFLSFSSYMTAGSPENFISVLNDMLITFLKVLCWILQSVLYQFFLPPRFVLILSEIVNS